MKELPGFGDCFPDDPTAEENWVDERMGILLKEFLKDEDKIREACESLAYVSDTLPLPDALFLLYKLNDRDPMDLLGSDLLTQIYLISKSVGRFIVSEIAVMAETEAWNELERIKEDSAISRYEDNKDDYDGL